LGIDSPELTVSQAADVTATAKPTPANYSLRFSGGQYAILEKSTQPTLGATFTIEAWVRNDGSSGPINPIVVNKNDSYEIGLNVQNPGGRDHAAYALRIDGKWDWIDANKSLTSGAWQHVALTHDGSQARFYVDGVLVQQTNAPGTIDASSFPLFIGARPNDSPGGSPNAFWTGEIDEVRIWSKARSGIELQSTMSQSLVGNEDNLEAYWDFNDGTGSDLASDRTTNNHDLTLGASSGNDLSDPTWSTETPFN